MPPDDEDIYQLSEADALDTPEPPEVPTAAGEVRPAAEALEQLDADGHTYALGDAVIPPKRGDLEILEHPPRWCLACGADLTLIDTGVCPGCEKQFNPTDPKTFGEEPPKELGNWWLQPPRVAGYALIGWFLVGRIITHAASGAVGQGLTTGTGSTNLSLSVGAVVSAAAVLSLIPWAVGGVLLGLVGIREHFNPKLSIAIPLGVGFGVLLTLGLPPAATFIGLVSGAFAGFLYAWRAT